MTGASHIIGNGSDEADAHAHGMKLEPGNERGHGTRHPPAVEHEYDRKAEGAGAIGRASRRNAGITAVEKPHDALADGGVGVMRTAVPQRPDTITAHHPRIEIAGGPPGGLSMEGRIDVVRPAFEPLHPQAAPGKGPHERDARRGLALARTGRGDAEGVECRMSHRLFPFPDASKRLSNRYSIHAKVLGERGWGFGEGKLFFRRGLLPNPIPAPYTSQHTPAPRTWPRRP